LSNYEAFRIRTDAATRRMQDELARVEEWLLVCPDAADWEIRHRLASLQTRINGIRQSLPEGAFSDARIAAE
jgi:hypothetical protein